MRTEREGSTYDENGKWEKAFPGLENPGGERGQEERGDGARLLYMETPAYECDMKTECQVIKIFPSIGNGTARSSQRGKTR